ncbi:MAG: hypothetical protein OXD29_11970 [Roseovarius sp.]|nr:hypothetical protein [Roseovarius sp.]
MDMSEPPDNHELDKRLSVMEERMNTIQANLDKTLQEFKTEAEKRETAAEKRETAAEKRDKTLLITLGGLIIGAIAIGVTILGLWLG